jgi:uncharacterized protein (TIRG00374 family)
MALKWIKSGIQLIVFLSLGLLLIWYSVCDFSANDIVTVRKLVSGANKMTVVYCILILMVSHLIRALRWRMMITPLGHKPRLSNVFYAVLTGFFFNLLFPRLGELMKCSLIGKYEKIPVDKLVGTMVAERFIDFCCLLLIIILTIVTQTSLVGNYTHELWTAFTLKLKGSFLLLLILLLFAFLMFYIFYKILKNSKLKWVVKIKALIAGITEGLNTIGQMQNSIVFVLYTIAIWFLYLGSIRAGFPAMAELNDLGWVPSLTVLTFGSFAMIATQGGIGAYQLAVQKTLELYGVSSLTGLAFGWLLWSVQTIMMIITGPVSLLLMYFQNKKSGRMET